MPTPKRRGRPRGSEINDNGLLQQVADLLVTVPTLKPTTAIRQVIEATRPHASTDSTLTRRLQGKWAARAKGLLQQARDRRSRQPIEANANAETVNLRPSPVYEQVLRVQHMLEQMPALRSVYAEAAAQLELLNSMDNPGIRDVRRMLEERERLLEAADPLRSIRWAMGSRHF